MFLGSVLSAVIVAIVTVYLAGIRFQNEEQAKQTSTAREKLRKMAASWAVDIHLFLGGQEDLPIVEDIDREQYRLCSAAIEAARPLRWPTRHATTLACRILFGREITALAEDVPYESLDHKDTFTFLMALYSRGSATGDGSNEIELGRFGEMMELRRRATKSGDRWVTNVPKVDSAYRAVDLLRVVRALGNLRSYHTITLSPTYRAGTARLLIALKLLVRTHPLRA